MVQEDECSVLFRPLTSRSAYASGLDPGVNETNNIHFLILERSNLELKVTPLEIRAGTYCSWGKTRSEEHQEKDIQKAI